VSTFFAAGYLGLGLPAVLTGLISQLISTVDASVYTSALVAAIVAAAILVVLRTFGIASAPKPTCPPSDAWCSPQVPATAIPTARPAHITESRPHRARHRSA
jgi:hypothetical protein